MKLLKEIRQEHRQLLQYLSDLESLPSKRGAIIPESISSLNKIFNFWDAHEQKEEDLFKTISKDFPVKSMETRHRQLRGHWKVLNLALNSQDQEVVKIAIDTDGKMFADKLKEHILIEERLFDKLERISTGFANTNQQILINPKNL